MRLLFAVLLIADGAVLLASQTRGTAWADAICDNAFGMCADLRWPLLAGVIIAGILGVMSIAR
jgi:hypothetical protein